MTQTELDARMMASFKRGADEAVGRFAGKRHLRPEDALDPVYLAARAFGEMAFWTFWAQVSRFDLEKYDSPMERVFHVALHLAAQSVMSEEPIWASCQSSKPMKPEALWPRHDPGEGHYRVSICSQHQMPPYRVDFLVVGQGWKGECRVVAEIDGHDFHEKTKEQARHDKQRDRAMVKAGYKVVRYTGSEVFADPVGLATEVINLALQS